jgi:hypothetical protein
LSQGLLTFISSPFGYATCVPPGPKKRVASRSVSRQVRYKNRYEILAGVSADRPKKRVRISTRSRLFVTNRSPRDRDLEMNRLFGRTLQLYAQIAEVIIRSHSDRARELGLPVRNDMPENMLQLMQLYPQPTRRQPSVEYAGSLPAASRWPASGKLRGVSAALPRDGSKRMTRREQASRVPRATNGRKNLCLGQTALGDSAGNKHALHPLRD